jgi:hypothetical protein
VLVISRAHFVEAQKIVEWCKTRSIRVVFAAVPRENRVERICSGTCRAPKSRRGQTTTDCGFPLSRLRANSSGRRDRIAKAKALDGHHISPRRRAASMELPGGRNMAAVPPNDFHHGLSPRRCGRALISAKRCRHARLAGCCQGERTHGTTASRLAALIASGRRRPRSCASRSCRKDSASA